MAITVDYSTAAPWLITIPQADLTLESGTKYKLDVDVFWSLLADFSDNENPVVRPKLYSRIPATTSTPSITEIEDQFYSLQFEDGLYSVNIINGNTNIRDVEVKNQVSVNTNNTTGFIDAQFLEHSTFQGAVHLDAINGGSGTSYPMGTPAAPVNNAIDAVAIANQRGFEEIHVIGNYTFTTGDDIDNFTIVGQNPVKSTVTIETGASANKVELFECHAIGILDGQSTARECLLTNLDYINGYIHNCILSPGTISLGGGTTAYFIDCTSGLPGLGTPTIDMGGSGQPLAIRNYNGGIKLTNKTGSDAASIDLGSGQVVLDSATVTGGTIVVRGDGKLVDENGNHLLSGTWNGGVTIVNETTSVLHDHTLDSIADAVWNHTQ